MSWNLNCKCKPKELTWQQKGYEPVSIELITRSLLPNVIVGQIEVNKKSISVVAYCKSISGAKIQGQFPSSDIENTYNTSYEFIIPYQKDLTFTHVKYYDKIYRLSGALENINLRNQDYRFFVNDKGLENNQNNYL